MARSQIFLTRAWLGWRLALGLVLALCAGLAQAVPSACTALWANSGGNLNYFNSTNNTWVTAAPAPVSGNALSGYEGDGALYFASGVVLPATIYKASFSNSTGSITFAQMAGGTQVQIPASFTYRQTSGATATATIQYLVGATLDRDTSSRRMFLLGTRDALGSIPVNGTNTTNSTIANIGLLDPESPGSVSWTTLYQTTGTGTITYPLLGNSGDIFADQQTGAIWYVTNTVPVRFYKIQLNYTGLTLSGAQVIQTATAALTTAAFTIGSVAVNPLTGQVYIGGAGGTSNLTYEITDHTASPTVIGTLRQNGTGVNDAGNCVAPPDPPTIEKSFNPTTATTPGTSLLTITINNPNKVPIYTTAALTDAFPANMSIHTTPGLTATCYSDGSPLASRPASTTITGAVGATSAVVNSGALIPGGSTSGGSCSFSVRVSATIANLYSNDIAAGALTTTAGANASAATATFQVQNISLPNAPTISKSFNPTTSTSAVGTATLTIVISNPNTVSNTVTSILRDILPANMRVANTPALTATCYSNGVVVTRPAATTITGTVGSTSATIALNSVIPGGTLPAGGSCSFSVRVSQTVAGISANTIPVGSLTTVSGSNVTEATDTYFLRASDFSVVKSQREGATGATTTGVIEVASSVTISYVINIRNTAGVAGTRTFTDTLPALITPTLSVVTATVAGATGCRIVTSTVAGATRIVGTVTGAPEGGGCDVEVLARVSSTAIISTATNVVAIAVVAGAVDTTAANDTSTVVLVIKPAANLSITKDDGKTQLLTGSTNSYTITVANSGPAGADEAVVKDPAATGLDCTDITCVASGGASCPLPAQLFVSALQSNTGLTIPVFPSGSTVTFVLSCTVTATGEP